jgi:hypothetical protein
MVEEHPVVFSGFPAGDCPVFPSSCQIFLQFAVVFLVDPVAAVDHSGD